jgi:protein required for attachment to host cells
METTWVIAADGSRARIFQVAQDQHLQEIEDMVNPGGRAEDHELESDARARLFGRGKHEQGHTTAAHVDAAGHEDEMFSKRLARYLGMAHSEHRYDKLCLIAPPRFLGLLRQNLSAEARRAVGDELAKELASLEARDIEAYLKRHLH